MLVFEALCKAFVILSVNLLLIKLPAFAAFSWTIFEAVFLALSRYFLLYLPLNF